MTWLSFFGILCVIALVVVLVIWDEKEGVSYYRKQIYEKINTGKDDTL